MAENLQVDNNTRKIQWHIRPNTQDLHILSEVYEKNCYRLPDKLPENTVVIDIGANIGAFSGLCLERGATAVYAYEPDRENLESLSSNLSDYVNAGGHGVLAISQCAVVGDSNPRFAIAWQKPFHETPEGMESTGGKNIFMLRPDNNSEDFEDVPTVRISQLIDMVSIDHPECDIWLKLDCEGSEHQILDSVNPDWARVTRIFGEVHAIHDGFDPDISGIRDWSNVQRVLISAGYSVQVDGNGPFRLFFAEKRPVALPGSLLLSGCQVERKPRILIVGDACYSTGFAACTHALADHLYPTWDVHILGINNHGDPHNYPYTVHPSYSPLKMASDDFGVDRLPGLIHELKPDLVIILQDPWNIRRYLESIRESGVYPVPPIIGWLAVDSRNQKTAIGCNGLHAIVAWTEFGEFELIAGGYRGPIHVVPLGVDTERFRPLDKVESRRQIFDVSLGQGVVGPDDYIVGVVGRNQYRKRIDLAIEYFAEWVSGLSDSPRRENKIWLYLHIAPTGEVGCDIGSLIEYHKLSGRVLINAPPVGIGLDSDLMPAMYNSLDCLLCTSQAEGWNLPALEAMACGIPPILPDSGGHDWAKTAAIMVPCTSNVLSAPINNRRQGMHTIGGVIDKQGTIDALNGLYSSAKLREVTGQAGRELAEKLTWQRMVTDMESILRGYLPQEFR